MRVAVLGIILVSLIFLTPIFKAGFYESHDGEAHVARFAAYYQAYSDGQFPARWAGDLNQGFGSPVFIFYYPLPGTLGSTLHVFGIINFETPFKILMIISFILAFLFIFWYFSRYFNNSHLGYLSMIFITAYFWPEEVKKHMRNESQSSIFSQ